MHIACLASGKRKTGYPVDLPEMLTSNRIYPAASFAHEIRNPLSTINLAIELLYGTTTDDIQRSYLDMILRASSAINLQVTELIAQRHTGHVHGRKYSMHQLLEEVLLLMADRLQLKKIFVSKVFARKDFETAIDIGGMKMALTNIILNAVEAMGNKGQLKLLTSFSRGSYSIVIEDDGCGISAKNIDQIFVPYYTMKKNGLGVGLAATKDILKENNVGVKVESVEGSGTKFTLTLPNDSARSPA